MAEPKTNEVIDLAKVAKNHLFVIEAVEEDEQTGVIEEEGYYFVIRGNKCTEENKKVISDILAEKAEEAITSNDAAKGQALLNASLRYNSNNVVALNWYGRLLRAAGLLQEAVEMYGRTLACDPSNVDALISRSNIYFRQLKKYYEAEFHLKIAMKFWPSDFVVLVTYAGYLSDVRQDFESAESLYKLAMTADSKTHPNLLFNYGVFLMDHRKNFPVFS